MTNAHVLSGLTGDQSAEQYLRQLQRKTIVGRDNEVRRVLGEVKMRIEEAVLLFFISV